MPAVPAEGISVQERNQNYSAKFKFNTPQKAFWGKDKLCQWKWAMYCKFWWQRKSFNSSLSGILAHVSGMLCREKWLAGLLTADLPAPLFWNLETKAPPLSGENLDLQDAENRLLSTEQPGSTWPKFCRKKIASAGTTLVQIRIHEEYFLRSLILCSLPSLQSSSQKKGIAKANTALEV